MNKHILFKTLTLASALLLGSATTTSCKFVKSILNTQIEDEDYIVGQLYADELVKETPVRFERATSGTISGGNRSTSGFGMELNDKDNRKLYSAIDSWYGTPYQYGGCTKQGVDCSCFVGNIFKSVYGATLKRSANDIQQDMDKFVNRSSLREGDIVFFTNSNGKVSHVGIYLKDDLFVHSSTSNGVSISSLENSYWKKHFYRGGRHKSVTTQYK